MVYHVVILKNKFRSVLSALAALLLIVSILFASGLNAATFVAAIVSAPAHAEYLHAASTQARKASVTIGGSFTLVAPDGGRVTDKTYAGKWLLVYFGYTYCPSVCPTALLEMATALKKLGPDASKLQGLFITVDPRRDTRAVMEAYTKFFDPRIIGLTGTAEQIAAVTKAYGVYFARNTTGPGPDDYDMDHSTYFYLMGPHGKFVRGFDTETTGGHIAEVLQKLMVEASDKGSPAGISKPEGH